MGHNHYPVRESGRSRRCATWWLSKFSKRPPPTGLLHLENGLLISARKQLSTTHHLPNRTIGTSPAVVTRTCKIWDLGDLSPRWPGSGGRQ